MKRFRRLATQLLALALVSAAPACGHPPSPSARAKPACTPMGVAAYEYALSQEPMSPQELGKLGAVEWQVYEEMLRIAHGPRDAWLNPNFADPEIPRYYGCMPATIKVEVYLRRIEDADRLVEDGFDVKSNWRDYDASLRSHGVVRVILSPSRLADIVRLPYVRRAGFRYGTLVSDVHTLLNRTRSHIGMPGLHVIAPDATGSGVVAVVMDTGIDWKHGTFRHADGRTPIKYIVVKAAGTHRSR